MSVFKAQGPEISVVIPAFNEAENLLELIPALKTFLNDDFEICVVDDGSTDQTREALRDLSLADPRVRYLSFSRNFGQVTALVAGLHFARGRAVITMDADFQHPLATLGELIREWRAGVEIVNTLRLNQNGVFSRLFYQVYRYWTGIRIEPGFADFRLFDRRAVEAIKQHAPEDVFLRGMVPELGFHQKTLSYQCEDRRHGITKYNFRKNLKLAARGLMSQASIGFTLPFYLAVLSLGLGFLSPQAALAVGFSLVLTVLGVFGIYLRRIYLRVAVRAPAYIVAESSEDLDRSPVLRSMAG